MRKEGKDLDTLPILKEKDLINMLGPHNRNVRVAAFCKICNRKFVTKPMTLEAKGFFCKSCKMKISRKNDSKEKKAAILEKYKKTCLEKYGVEFAGQASQVKEKFKQTCLDKYGATHFANNEKVREKTKQTCLEKYGAESTFQSQEIQSKIKEVMLEKYGVEHALQSPTCLEKLKQTNKEKYGTECTFNWEGQKEKTKNTLLKKYGVSNAAQCESARKKQSEHWQERTPGQIKNIRSKSSFKYYYQGINFDSAWELALWIYAKDHDESIIKEPASFQYEFEGKLHTYIPDFEYKGKLVEIKGNHFFKEGKMINPFDRSQDDKYNAKYKCGLANGVSFWKEEDMQFVWDYIEKTYTKDFIPLFKTGLPFPYPKLKKGDFWVIKHFHKSLYEASRKGKFSAIQAWEDKDLILKSALNRLQYVGKCDPETILTGFNVAKIAPKVSVFKPEKAKYLIEKYLKEVQEIFDPFSGFSGRLIATCRLGKKYIGQDIHPKHVEESNEIVQYLQLQNCQVIQQDILTDIEQCHECLFTCPPYGGKEHWNENNDEVEKTCDEWIDLCLEKYKCKKYLFVVDKTEKYKDYIVESIENKSHFGTNNEYVIFIQK